MSIQVIRKKWKKLKCILLSEISQFEKGIYCMIPTIWHPGKDKTMEKVKRSLLALDKGWGWD